MSDDKISDVEHLARILSRENAKEVVAALRAKCGVRRVGVVRPKVFIAVTAEAIEEVFAELAPSFLRRERMMVEMRARAAGTYEEMVPASEVEARLEAVRVEVATEKSVSAAGDNRAVAAGDSADGNRAVVGEDAEKTKSIPIQIIEALPSATGRANSKPDASGSEVVETAAAKWRREMAEKRERRRQEDHERRERERFERERASEAFDLPVTITPPPPKPAGGFNALSLAERKEAAKQREQEKHNEMVEAMLRGTRGAAE